MKLQRFAVCLLILAVLSLAVLVPGTAIADVSTSSAGEDNSHNYTFQAQYQGLLQGIGYSGSDDVPSVAGVHTIVSYSADGSNWTQVLDTTNNPFSVSGAGQGVGQMLTSLGHGNIYNLQAVFEDSSGTVLMTLTVSGIEWGNTSSGGTATNEAAVSNNASGASGSGDASSSSNSSSSGGAAGSGSASSTGTSGSNDAANGSATDQPAGSGGPFAQVIAGLLDDVTAAINDAANALGFTNLNEAIFNVGLTDEQKNLAPFGTDSNGQQIWNDAFKWYEGVAAGVFILILIVVCITSFKFMASPFNKNIREDAIESFWRWLLAVLIVAGAPFLYIILLKINNGLVDLFLGVAQTVRPGVDLMAYFNAGSSAAVTGNVIYTSVVKLVFQGVRLWLGVLFEMRKLVLLVIFIFTPLMAILWAINKNVNAAGIWLGEIVSNVFMQCSYAFVFLILITFIAVPQAGTGSAALTTAGAATLGQAVSGIITDYGLPIGGTLLLVSVCWVAIQIMFSRFVSNKRESAYGNLFYVGIGGVILGGVVFIGSVVYNIGQKYFGYAFNAPAQGAAASSSQPNIIVILIWLVAMLPIAEMIRNSMQGLLTRRSEFDEAGFATKSLAAIAGLGGLMGLAHLGRASFGGAAAGGYMGGTLSKLGGSGEGSSAAGGGGADQAIQLQGKEVPPGGEPGATGQSSPAPGAGLIGGLHSAASFGERAGARVGGAAGKLTSTFVAGATALAGSVIPGGRHLAEVGEKFGNAVGKVAEHGVGAVTRGVATHGHLAKQTVSDWRSQGRSEGYGIGESFRRVTGGEHFGDAVGRSMKVAGANTVHPYFAGKTLVGMKPKPKPSLDGYRPDNSSA